MAFIRVLGSANWLQTKGNDHSYYTISDRALIDCGSSAVMNLLNHDVDPAQIRTVFFTHMHADHYMGLGPLLLYWRITLGDLGLITLVGPKATLEKAVMGALHYAFHDSSDMMAEIRRLPNIVPLSEGDSFDAGFVRAEVIASDHAVPGLCYRFTDPDTKGTACFTGDTRYQEGYGAFFRDADLLFHEVAHAEGPLSPDNHICRHSSAVEAVRVAEEAQARRLILTHAFEPRREAALEKAHSLTKIPTEWAVPGKVFEF